VIGYQPSKEAKETTTAIANDISVVEIPCKPHPNGLEIMTVTTFVDDLNTMKDAPFVVLMIPHV